MKYLCKKTLKMFGERKKKNIYKEGICTYKSKKTYYAHIQFPQTD